MKSTRSVGRRSVGAWGYAAAVALVAAPLLQACTVAVASTVPSYTISQEVAGIPPGHMPPPGSCRIWFPGEPPGQQPPPGDCAEISRSVPSDAWLLHRPGEERRVFRVH